ncbi:MAG: hypothetical protein O7D34_11910 [Ignavibacteria bacterium]|nr:hypothetical protein [Ignavibacteria bacterium]
MFICVGIYMVGSGTYAQSLISPRAIGIGAYNALVNDSRAFVANPAGLTGIRDWDFNTSTYILRTFSRSGFVFYGLGIGKRLLENSAVALQYSPGISLEFVVPTTITFTGPNPTSIDQRISYDEPFSFGYGHRLSDEVSVGVSGRMRKETVVDTRYEIVPGDTTFIKTTESTFDGSLWNFDLGLAWRPNSKIALSLGGRNVVQIRQNSLPEDFDSLQLSNKSSVEIGGAYNITPSFTVAAEASTAKTGSVGYEWELGSDIALRNGIYWSVDESPFVDAVGVSIGWSYGFIELDASYLWFLNQDNRQGSSLVQEFDAGDLRSIELNRYTSDRLSFSVKAMFGIIRESLARIEGVDLFGGIYPSSYEVLAYRPIGTVRVRNISAKPIHVKASFYVEKYMDAPTEAKPVYIMPDEETDIPLTAVFNEEVKNVPQMTVREGTVFVSATPAEEYDDRFQTPVLIYGRNDWDGKVLSLRYFVRPNDPEVIRYTRDILLQTKDSLGSIVGPMDSFQRARVLFNAFAGKLVYVNDPKQSADFVQYPSETLSLRGGDCDDMTVAFSSLLNSVGISTAFVDVVPPEQPENSHIFLLFDTGVDPRFGGNISRNPKRYVVRKNAKGVETIWIPIETTVITRGFDEAWTSGAQEYFDEVEVGLGLIKGSVRIVDVY